MSIEGPLLSMHTEVCVEHLTPLDLNYFEDHSYLRVDFNGVLKLRGSNSIPLEFLASMLTTAAIRGASLFATTSKEALKDADFVQQGKEWSGVKNVQLSLWIKQAKLE
jgi:hypothetical protein